jgi:hypothetical protein
MDTDQRVNPEAISPVAVLEDVVVLPAPSPLDYWDLPGIHAVGIAIPKR